MRKLPFLLGLVLNLALLAAAGAAAAQAPKPAAEEEKRTESAPSAPRRLNLKLDNPSQYSRELPRDDAAPASSTLPTLGGNALPMEAPPPPRRDTPSSSYPVGQ